jgi:hypothetical protein
MTTQPDARRFGLSPKGRSAAVIGAAFVIPFLVYLRTLTPSVAGGDSGELTAAAYVLGVPHATGYPLYVMLLHVFQRLAAFGSIAYRSNLFSALTMAGMCAAWAWVYRRAGGSGPGALLAALTPAFMSITWSEATRAETYGLHVLFLALAIGCFLRWERLRTGRSLVWFALASGFALSHHRTSLFVLAPFLALALVRHRPWTWSQGLKTALVLIAPFAAYAYLPIRAAANPPVNWGYIRSWQDLVNHALGRQYAGYIASEPWQHWLRFLLQGLFAVPAMQMSVVAVALTLLGAGAVLRKRRVEGVCAIAGVALLAGWASIWGYGQVKWFIPVFMIYGAWLAAGVETVAAGLGRLGATARRGPVVVRVGAMLAFPLLLLSNNLGAEDHSREWGYYDWGRILMAEVEPNAVVALSGETRVQVASYFQVVERARPDVEIAIPAMMAAEWVQRQIEDPMVKRLIRLALDTNPERTSEGFADHLMPLLVPYYAPRRPLYYDRPLTKLYYGYQTLAYQAVYQFVPAQPSFLKADGVAPPRGDFPPVNFSHTPLGEHGERAALVLAAAQSEPRTVRRGDLFRLRLAWRCTGETRGPLEILAFLERDESGRPGGLAELFAGGSSVQLLWGESPISPSPPGTHYEQQVWYVAPREIAPGRYVIRLVPHPLPGGLILAEPKPVARLEVAP